MKKESFFLDTHALYFWVTGETVSSYYLEFLDNSAAKGKVFYSPVSLWELALLTKKKRVSIDNLTEWCDNLIALSPAELVQPSVADMIESTRLADHHKDPFDRLLIAQARSMNAVMVTKDDIIKKYRIKTLWVD